MAKCAVVVVDSADGRMPMNDSLTSVEEIQRQALMVVGNALRSSQLMGTANLQHVQLGLMHWLEGLVDLPRGAPLDATQFYEFLKGQGVAKDAAIEVILMLRSMEDRLGFLIALPTEVEKLSDTKKQVILDKYQKRTRAPTFVQGPTPAPGTPSATSQAADQFKKKKAMPKGAGLALFGVLAAGGLFAVQYFEEPPPPVEQLNLSMPPEAFSCREITHVRKMVMCKLPVAEWDAIPPGEIQRRLDATSAFIRSKGYSNVFVMTSEDNKTRVGK